MDKGTFVEQRTEKLSQPTTLLPFEHRWQMAFPRTTAGWRRLFWLSLSRCPIHHKCLHPNWPYDELMYGFCCDGVSYWHTGFLKTLRINYLALTQKSGEKQ